MEPGHKRKPRKPWRAPTAYEIFCKQERPKLKAQYGAVGSREINKQLGALWNTFAKAERSKYSKEAKGEK